MFPDWKQYRKNKLGGGKQERRLEIRALVLNMSCSSFLNTNKTWSTPILGGGDMWKEIEKEHLVSRRKFKRVQFPRS